MCIGDRNTIMLGLWKVVEHSGHIVSCPFNLFGDDQCKITLHVAFGIY